MTACTVVFGCCCILSFPKMSSLTTDPDERALLYIMQWMSERGYSKGKVVMLVSCADRLFQDHALHSRRVD